MESPAPEGTGRAGEGASSAQGYGVVGPGPVQSHLSPSYPLFAVTRLAIEITLCRMFMEHIFHSVSKYRSPMPALASG